MDRRTFISILVAGLFMASLSDAQRPARLPRVGFLGMDSQMQAERLAAFQERLRALDSREASRIQEAISRDSCSTIRSYPPNGLSYCGRRVRISRALRCSGTRKAAV